MIAIYEIRAVYIAYQYRYYSYLVVSPLNSSHALLQEKKTGLPVLDCVSDFLNKVGKSTIKTLNSQKLPELYYFSVLSLLIWTTSSTSLSYEDEEYYTTEELIIYTKFSMPLLGGPRLTVGSMNVIFLLL